MWNAISENGFKNSEHVDDFRKRLKTYLLKKIPLLHYSACLVYLWSSSFFNIAYCCVSFFK